MDPVSQADKTDPLQSLRRPIYLTWAGLLAERVVASFWPMICIGFAALAVLMLGLHDLVPREMAWGGALIVILSLVYATLRGVQRFRLPRQAHALERLDNSLKSRPIQAMLDGMALGGQDRASQAIWQVHQARMARQAAKARAIPPDLDTKRADPFALRYVALVAISIALLFGSLSRVASVSQIATPQAPALAAGPVWEGWIEPPLYTGAPVLYLSDLPAGDLNIPKGSIISVRFYGEVGALSLTQTLSAGTGESSEMAHEFAAVQPGLLEIAGQGGRRWSIALIEDLPPQITTAGEVTASALGEMTLPFNAQDDYGVEAGEARFQLDLARVERLYGLTIDPEPRPALLASLPVPFSGARDAFDEELIEDFSKHPWANLPVTLELVALDGAEQEGRSGLQEIVLPGRRFFDPMAAAMIEMRRDILWNRSNTKRAAQILRALAHRPDEVFRKDLARLRTQRLIERMELFASYDLSDETQDRLAEELWELALTIEVGDLADALARLERARERLEEAMRNGASPEEIAELMRELRAATEDYLRQLSRQAELDEESPAPNPNSESMMLSQDDIQRMMDRIQELMEQGRMAEAAQAMQELQEILENLRMSQAQGGQGPGEQAMEGLGETLREQQGLADDAFRDLQEQANPGGQAGESQGNEGRNGGQGRGQSHEGQQGQNPSQGEGQSEGDGGEGALADRQQALRQELQRQERNLPGAGTEAGEAAREALGRAGDAMDRAEDNLRAQDFADAIENQSQAMDALREGLQHLGEAMRERQNGQPGQGQQAGSTGESGSSRDPLGRDGMSNQPGGGHNLGIEPGTERERAQELSEDIQRRYRDRSRDQDERDYLKRLLEKF